MSVFGVGSRETGEARPLVLVVNNDAAMRDALRFLLRLEGLDVQAHADGAACLASPDLPRVKCLVLKDRLPGLDSFEFLQNLNARNLWPPTILLTGAASPELQRRAQAAGVWRVLEKPILDNQLVDAVTSALTGPTAGPNILPT